MKKNTWLIVANSSVAKIFNINNHHALEEITALEHNESRLHNLDIVSDKPGRSFERSSITRHGVGPANTPKEHEFEVFAKELANFLNQAYNQNQFNNLYITAPPKFLGLLRLELSDNIRKCISGEFDKELTHLDHSDILQHLAIFAAI